MYLDPNWRILTIGDGDLSFSSSLLSHHQPRQLTASIYDDLATLTNKYGDDFYQLLRQKNCPVFTKVDITNPDSWEHIPRQQFDLVIFQFPLIPAFQNKADFEKANTNSNLLNRHLLRQFLLNCSAQFLDPQGEQLCFITSKDVKPYSEWNIEHSLTLNTDINFLGSMPFDISKFPDYRIRNVDRDKHVKDTKGITYVWRANLNPSSHRDSSWITELQPATQTYFLTDPQFCACCDAGPFTSEQHKSDHEKSRRHIRMFKYEKQWQQAILNEQNKSKEA